MHSQLPRLGWLVVLSLCLMYTARAADPQRYRVVIASTEDGALDNTLRATSELVALRQSSPVSPFALIVRARGEVDRLKTVLESYGYYRSTVKIQIDGVGLNSPGLADKLAALPKDAEARVDIGFDLGPLYHLRNVTLDGTVPPTVESAFTLKSGAPAVAAEVLAAGARLRTALQDQGYAFAKVDAPVAYEDATQPVLDVSFHVVAGQKVKIGKIALEGLVRVHESLVRRRLTLHTGQQYNPGAIEAARRDLQTLGPFSAITVKLGDAVDSTGGVPVTFVLRERLRHAVSFNPGYSSDLGGSLGVTWSDRNVFGNAEQLNLTANAINLGGGSATTGIGYDTAAKFTVPEFGHRDQTLLVETEAVKQSLQAYDQKALNAGVTLSRKLSAVWKVSAGLATSDEQIIQEEIRTPLSSGEFIHGCCDRQPLLLGHYSYTLVAVPLGVNYDSTHLASPLDDPTHGMRDSLTVRPTLALGTPNAEFIISQLSLASYFDLHELGLGDPDRTVLALRALAGKAQGAGQLSLPPDQRFYGGGSGTIRGYRYQSVGPLFPADKNPIGGTAIAAGTVELRHRFGADFGGAAFVDAGQVSSSFKSIASDFRIGAGFGIRYYTPIGPVRFDVAVPVERRPSDDAFEIYVGLGQAV